MVESFEIVPATPRSFLWIFALLALVLVVAGGAIVASALGARTARFELSSAGLRLRGDLWGRTVALDEILGARARLVDLAAEPDLQPRLRTMGTSVGGYQSGWFRLRNGEKALLYLTDRRHVVYLPTRSGYSLLLSVREPERFLTRLRELAPAG